MQRRPLFQLVLGACLFALLAAGCSSANQQATALAVVPDAELPTPTAIATTAPLQVPTATPTPAPTPTAVPTATPTPSATPVPTVPPLPTATQPPAPTQPPAASPTTAPVLTATAVPEPTATAIPEATSTTVPEASATPEPDARATSTAESTPVPEATATAAPVAPAEHVVVAAGYVTLGQAGGTMLTMPSALVELIGFHEASHPGSQAINAAGTGLPLTVLESRGRGTPSRSAADIVVPPGEPLRAPVTGTVVSSRTYVLYCEHQDQLVYIEPDGLPGWQVRLFHVQGETPAVGTRVIAGETIVASGGANPLPFESQIDEFTAEPSWAHVHLEVVDTSVPDDRPPGGGC